MIQPLRWSGDHLELVDQRALPLRESWIACRTWQDVALAIRDMIVRGAPAIGIAAAYGMALAAREADALPAEARPALLRQAAEGLIAARPTAVNLAWAVERQQARAASGGPGHFEELLGEARRIHEDDVTANRRMAEFGAALLPAGARVYTHCNTGALATGGHGTALGIIRTAYAAGLLRHVWVGETRPRLQGARLTMWELLQEGIPATLVTDGTAAPLMARGEVDAVVVGADRVARNGDVANKIGTYALALAARHHGIPFYVAAPWSTFDPATADGSGIPLEERDAGEITRAGDVALAPAGVRVWNPAFDVTPAELVDAIITERGVARAPLAKSLAALTGVATDG